MERILKQRQINSLYHFTQAENLLSIFNYGLLPRKILENKGIHSCFNDDYRFDNCLCAICMSIEFPNYKMFYKLRQKDSAVDWAVLQLNAQILCDYPCAFCWTNAGDSAMFNTSLGERMSMNAFLELFENRQGYPEREKLKIADWYPTNPQAEVLVFGIIPINYVQNVYFQDEQVFAKYKNGIPSCIGVRVDDKVFKYRNDWEYWKN